jgi:ion channel POLLUX/CASTOR
MSGGFSLRQRIRYRFDNTLSRGLWAVLLWLGAVAGLFFLLMAFIISLSGIGPNDEGTSFGDGLWLSLTRSLDPGTFSGDDGSRFRIIMLFVTLAGIFIAATIIGLVSSAIDSRVESLRRGKSLVIESGHTLIVGWSDKLPTIVSELVEANVSERGRAIVVLTAEDTVQVTEDIRAVVTDLKTSRLVVRSGLPTRLHDLAQGNPQDAKSVIVLRAAEGSDAQVVKVVLALSRLVPGLEGLTVVAELDDAHTSEALKQAVGPSLITVTPMDVIARIGAQVSRAAGLGAIYQELLDFDGDEMYTAPAPAAYVGRSFGELLLGASNATVLGLRHADGTVELSPTPGTLVESGDHVIGIAEDDSTFVFDRAPVAWEPGTERHAEPVERLQERTLIVGWSDLAPLIAHEIETHVAPGSELHLMVNDDLHDVSRIGQAMGLTQQSLVIHEGDPIDRAAIVRVMDEGPFDHIMLLSEREKFTADEADARTLLTLMHVRLAADATPHEENIVAELLDPHDVELGGSSENHDFIVSQKLISLLMAQLSESPHLAPVFADLFDSDGAVVALHPAERYVPLGETTFGDIVSSARGWDTVAIGYRAASATGEKGSLGGGLRINAPKDHRVTLAPGDSIVVISRA